MEWCEALALRKEGTGQSKGTEAYNRCSHPYGPGTKALLFLSRFQLGDRIPLPRCPQSLFIFQYSRFLDKWLPISPHSPLPTMEILKPGEAAPLTHGGPLGSLILSLQFRTNKCWIFQIFQRIFLGNI